MKSEKNFLSIKEVAKFFGISYYTIFDKVREGKIKHIRIGRKVLIPKEEVLRISKEGV